MTEEYGAAFEFAHGRLYYATDPYSPKVDRPMPEPNEGSLMEALGEFRPGMSQITLVQLDCPDVCLSSAERAWRDIPADALKQRLGIPVRRETDIRLLVQGLAAQDEPVEFPYGVVILHDSDNDKCGGYVRKYRVTDRKHWKQVPFRVAGGSQLLMGVGAPELPLSQSSPDVLEVVKTFIADHPEVPRLVVWSPDDLPIQYGAYNELNPDNSVACRVTMLTNNTFVLSAALRQS